MKVMKFGGGSIQNAKKIRQVISIIQSEAGDDLCVVFSAMKGMTDSLLAAAKSAERGRTDYRDIISRIRRRLVRAVDGLLPKQERKKALAPLLSRCEELLDILNGIELVMECTPRSLDLVMSFGERLCCRLITSALESRGMEASYCDARSLIVTDDHYGHARVAFTPTYRKIRRKMASVRGSVAVVTGFIASTEDGVTTTLGRNGADYTAALLAAGTGARAFEIWKDVDGVLSADPHVVKEAFVISEVSYEEAMEMSSFGAEVLHSSTMGPVMEKGIPMWIKNALNPAAPGTRIARDIKGNEWPITNIASLKNVALVNVEGNGMRGTPGIASRVFGVLARADVNVIMISQASSEHSICVVVRADQAKKALADLKAEFVKERKARQIEKFQLLRDLEIIAVIGGNMRGMPGLSGRLFSAMGQNNINVLAIAQGSSERNISFVVESKDAKEAIMAVHRAFFGGEGK